jgi:hypothetical protein
LTAGLIPKAALALVRAGFHSLVDLQKVTRGELLAIPGVGYSSLEVLEQVLGEPLPGKPVPSHRLPPWPESVWRKRGLHADAAITFAQMGMTIERLKTMTREELLSLRGVGIGSLRTCELIIGRKIPTRRMSDPVEAFWRGQGISPKTAGVLSQAGIRSLEDLREQSREDLLALRGIGGISLERLETLLGGRIPSRAAFWLSRGLDVGVANVLVREGINDLDDLGNLTCKRFLSFRGAGYRALGQCEKLLGRRLS